MNTADNSYSINPLKNQSTDVCERENLRDLRQTHLASGANSHQPEKLQQEKQQGEEEKECIVLPHVRGDQIL